MKEKVIPWEMGSKTTSTKVQFSQFLLLLKFVDGYFSLSISFDFKNQFLYPLVWLDHFEPNFKCKTASESYKHRDYTSSIHFSKAGKKCLKSQTKIWKKEK